MRFHVLWLALLLVSCTTLQVPPTSGSTLRIVSHTHTIVSDIRPRYSITGELINDSGTPVYSAQIQAKYFDDLDRPLGEMSTTAALQMIEPGQRSPFFITLSADMSLLESVKYYNLTVISNTTPPESGDVVPLKITMYRLQLPSSQERANLVIIGEVTNTSGAQISHVRIIETVYDERGQISSYDHISMLGQIESPQEGLGIGETAPFVLRTSVVSQGSIAQLPDGYTYTVQAEGYK